MMVKQRNLLFLLGTPQYIFSLECINVANYASVAALSLTVNSAPNSQAEFPQCAATPRNAKPVIGKFSYECFQFSDLDGPLAYQFGYSVVGVSDVSIQAVSLSSLSARDVFLHLYSCVFTNVKQRV
jgi:hypothetical protein